LNEFIEVPCEPISNIPGQWDQRARLRLLEEQQGIVQCAQTYIREPMERNTQTKKEDINKYEVQFVHHRSDFRSYLDTMVWSTRCFEDCRTFHPPLPEQSASGQYDCELGRLARSLGNFRVLSFWVWAVQ
jgi:hypothetical protein